MQKEKGRSRKTLIVTLLSGKKRMHQEGIEPPSPVNLKRTNPDHGRLAS